VIDPREALASGLSSLRHHARHLSSEQVVARGPYRHVRLRTYPDDGVSRLRLDGRIEAP
jgi:allantoicase